MSDLVNLGAKLQVKNGWKVTRLDFLVTSVPKFYFSLIRSSLSTIHKTATHGTNLYIYLKNLSVKSILSEPQGYNEGILSCNIDVDLH